MTEQNQLLREALNTAQSKLLSAQICHPNAVQFLIEEAIDAINAALAQPAEGGEVEYWGSLAQQKADADKARGVSMPVSYYAEAAVSALLSHQRLTTPPASQEQAPVKLAPSRKGRVYVAGPMTGIEDFNFPAFNRAAEELRTLGLTVLNPADHGVVEGATWADYLRHDIALLSTCERIHLLPGWPKSKGARLELHIAQTLGLEVTTAPGASPPQAQQPSTQAWANETGLRQIECPSCGDLAVAYDPQQPSGEVVPKRLIGWRTENFLWETDDLDKARNWEPNIGVLPIFEGDPNTKLTAAPRPEPMTDEAKTIRDANRYLWWVTTMFNAPSEVAKVLAPCKSPDDVDAAIDRAMDGITAQAGEKQG